MDNERNEQQGLQPEDNDWLEEFLRAHEAQEELGADEQAVHSAGLTDIGDLELERILQEAKSADWPEEPEPAPPEPAPVAYDQYTDSGDEPAPPPQAEPEEEDNGPVRKVRPKRRSGYGLLGIPHIISSAIWLLLAVAIGVSLGRLLWVCATDVLAFGREDQTVTLTITDQDTMDTIAQKLYNAGLVKYPGLFKMYAGISNADQKITTGTFTLNTLFDYHAVVSGLSSSSSFREVVEDVLIPEGYTCAQIFALLEEKGVCSAASLEKYAAESDFESYDFLEGVQRGDKYTLEGFLFPDTYDFYYNSTPKEVFIKFLNRFDNQYDEELRGYTDTVNESLSQKMRANGYDDSYISEHQLTSYDIIIIASMIEKESANSQESRTIASVIYNRLANPDYPYLNIDATLVYALGGKAELTEDDFKLDSPYNTYMYRGLPPTPISNPGISSIMAALSPEDTGYYYYALDPATGMHHFSKTYQEHLDFLSSLDS